MANITTQWGIEARPFSDYTQAELKYILAKASELAKQIHENTGVFVFLSYGALLGAIREGGLIAHDFDIDFAFAPSDLNCASVMGATKKIIRYLTEKGFEIQFETNGHFKATNFNSEYPVEVEFFASWADKDDFFSYFAVRGTISVDEIFPLSTTDLNGVKFSCPKNPESLLEAIYGNRWRVPDPQFRYGLGPLEWKPFAFLFTKQSQDFWESYYDKSIDNSVWLEQPSDFAMEVSREFTFGEKLIEFGTGNGRDGLYFAQLGMDVTVCDYSTNALNFCKKRADNSQLSVAIKELDVSDCLMCYAFKKEFRNSIDIIYARFFLHAISDAAEENFFSVTHSSLRLGGEVCVEFRALDKNGFQAIHFESGDHFRRLIDIDKLVERVEFMGFRVMSQQQSHGLSVFRSEDPYIGRLILEKI